MSQFNNGHTSVTVPACKPEDTEELVILDLPAPLQYKITENETSYAKCTYVTTGGASPGGTGDIAQSTTGWQISAGSQKSGIEGTTPGSIFTNNRKMDGKLRLNKIVTGVDEPLDEEFTFNVRITMEDGVQSFPLNPTVTVIAGPHEGDTYEWNGTWTDVSEQDSETGRSYCFNTSSFTLFEGDTIRIDGLPVGAKYEVTETDNEKFLVWSSSGTSGVVTEEGTTATITNLYLHDVIPATGARAIEKSLPFITMILAGILVAMLKKKTGE